MNFGRLEDKEDGEYNGTDFVKISEIFTMQDAFILATFDRV